MGETRMQKPRSARRRRRPAVVLSPAILEQEEGDVPMQQQQMGKRAWEAAGVQQPSRGPNEVHYQRYTVDQLEAIAQDPRSSMPLMHSQGHSQGHSYGDDFPSDDGETAALRKRRRGQATRQQCLEDMAGDDGGSQGLDPFDTEKTIRRAKNREAARKSRERKMVRLDTLEKSVAELQQENELLARCIREISEQAISAEEETQFMREQIQAIRAMAATPEDQAVIDQLLDNAKALARSRPPLLQQPAKAYPPNLPSPLEAGEGDDQAGHEHSPGIGEEEEEDPAAAGYDAWLAGGAGAAPASAANTSGLASDSTAVAYGAGAARALYASPPEAGGRQNRPGSAGGDVAFSQPLADAAAYTPILGRAGGRAGAYAGAAQQRVDMAIACEGNAAGRFLHPDLYRQAALFAVDEEQDPEAQQPPPPLQEQGTQRRSARGGQSLHREDSGVGAAAALPQSHPELQEAACAGPAGYPARSVSPAEQEHPSRASASPDLLRCREPPVAMHSPESDPLIGARGPPGGGGGRYADEEEGGPPLAHLRHCELYVHEAALLPAMRYAVT